LKEAAFGRLLSFDIRFMGVTHMAKVKVTITRNTFIGGVLAEIGEEVLVSKEEAADLFAMKKAAKPGSDAAKVAIAAKKKAAAAVKKAAAKVKQSDQQSGEGSEPTE